MTGADPRRPSPRGRLRPVPEPDRPPPHNLEAEEAVLGADPDRRTAAGRGRRRPRGGRLLPASPPGHLAGHAPPGRPRPAHRPGHRAGGAGPQPASWPTWAVARSSTPSLQAVPTVANAGHYAQLVAETARRRRVIDLGIRLAHSDADPAVLAHLAGELADTTTGGDRHGWAPPTPFGIADEVPAFPVEVLPGWLGEYVAAVATATQTPPDLAGMLALAVLATVAAGAVEVQPRPGWREPLCLFVAVGMDAGTRKSSVFTALTRPRRRVRTRPGHRGPPGDHRDHHPAPHRRPSRRPRRSRGQQSPGRPAGRTPGRGDRPGRRGRQPDRAPGAQVAGRRRHPRGPGRPAGHLRPHRPAVSPRVMCSTRWPAATTRTPAPTWASTSRATPGTCSRSTAAAAHPNTSNGHV